MTTLTSSSVIALVVISPAARQSGRHVKVPTAVDLDACEMEMCLMANAAPQGRGEGMMCWFGKPHWWKYNEFGPAVCRVCGVHKAEEGKP